MTPVSESALLASGWSKAGPEDLRFLGLAADWNGVMVVKRSGEVFARVREAGCSVWVVWVINKAANRHVWAAVATVEDANEMFKELITGVKVAK
jgi:hypothetical protein